MTTIKVGHPESAVVAARAPARFSRRVQAAAVDVLVHGASLVTTMSLLELVPGHRHATSAAFAVWLGFAICYEPVLVSRRGATLGHALSHLRVVDLETGARPDLSSAFARFWLKATSGILGFTLAAITGRPHAPHDLAAGTVVQETE
jgi:uncharacterized RDD family membrane protein YckC